MEERSKNILQDNFNEANIQSIKKHMDLSKGGYRNKVYTMVQINSPSSVKPSKVGMRKTAKDLLR